MNLGIATDYTVFDNLEPVTLLSRTAAGAFVSYALPNALRHEQEKQEAAFGDTAQAKRTVLWNVWQPDLTAASAPAPKWGDQIQDAAGVTYAVTEAKFGALLQKWRLQTTLTV